MKTTLVAACLAIGTLMAPFSVLAADGDADRAHPGAFVKDSIITTKVKAKLAAEKLRTLAHVSVDTDRNGIVVLSGTTTTQEGADRAVAIATATEGVSSVQSRITIKKDD